MDLQLLASVIVTLFVIMDPPGTVPIFMSLTAQLSAKDRNRSAFQALLVATGVIVLFAIFGQSILNYMHISLAALQGAGGLLLVLIALQLLTGNTSGEENAAKYKNVAFVPLGTPLMAGPGAIVAVMVFVQQSTELSDYLAVGTGIAVVLASLYLAMRFAGVVQRVLGENGVELVTRIAGLLLSAIAVQMIADSVTAFVKGAA
ncbi:MULTISPECIES: MarC family protein [Paenarthrobacter]|jgi:multiple antibiotic resistance protein|uniref:MarC family protein n=1 Tax=Paenarthrobacter TaxID=1742992 RepID=UPI00119D8912|nr:MULTISPECIES: MarC family protein [Paenarthrobacter]MDD7835340.1 MarC family protein [Paenarthrobacter sp. AB444]MDP9935361.1 multiple antibiotic resistance protein [Paenarthrobacter nicotinovorans]UXM90413.1 MarC family protein [Paenarthrobacter sp. JL.01a]